MTTLSKVNIKGVDYSLDGVKVADLKKYVDVDNNVVEFSLDAKIDFLKGFKIDIFKNGSLFKSYIFNGIYEGSNGMNLMCTDVATNTTLTFNEANNDDIFEGIFSGGASMYYYNTDDYDYVSITFTLSKLQSDNLTAKIYYHETNETTQYFGYEY